MKASVRSVYNDALKHALVSALVYVAVTLVMGRGVLASLTTSIANDVQDPVLNAAILAWNARHVPWTDAWFQFPIFHPAADVLTFSEHLLGVSVIATPLHWLTGNTIAAYNLTVLLSHPLSALAMYLLVWRLTGNHAAAFLAGLAFGFAPYRAAELGHIQVLAAFWAPLALLGLHGYFETRQPRWLLLFGVGWMLQGAANGYFLVFFTVVVGLWIAWFGLAARRWRDTAAAGAALLAAALPLAPILYRYVIVHERYGFMRDEETIRYFSARITAPGCPHEGLTFWGWLGGNCGPEGHLFVGPALVALCAFGVWWTVRASRGERSARRSVAAFYLGTAIVCWMMTWGLSGPYALLSLLPGMDGLRVPARFWMMAVLCLSVLLGVVLAPWLQHQSPRRLVVAAGLMAVALLSAGWMPMRTARGPQPPPAPELLRGQTVMTLPIPREDFVAQYFAVDGGWRSVNGASGYEPAHYDVLRQASRYEADNLFLPFVADADLHVVVAQDAPRLIALVERQPGVEETARDAQWRQYRLPVRRDPLLVEARGRALPAVSLSASCGEESLAMTRDGDPGTRWHCGPQTRDQEVRVDLGAAAPVGAVVAALGAFPNDFPRHLVVETSMDGMAWQPAWGGPVEPAAVVATFRDPKQIPLSVSFQPRAARYVRLRNTGRHDTWYWSIAELDVRAP